MKNVLLVIAAASLALVPLLSPLIHATPPAVPCDYECMWPIGLYDIPDSAKVGTPITVSYTYAWEGILNGIAVNTDTWDLPPGYHPWPEEWGEPTRPPQYIGSTATMVLPEGIDVVDWETRGFERSKLWTDQYGRTTYMYTKTNAYAPGTTNASIELVVRTDAKIYPNDGVIVDLGVRREKWADPTLFVNHSGGALTFSADEAVIAAGASESFRQRDIRRLPDSSFDPLEDEELSGEAKRAIVEFLLDRADAGAVVGESGIPDFARAQVTEHAKESGVGGQADGEQFTYAYGYFRAQDRGQGAGVETAKLSAATDVKVCLYDQTADRSISPLLHNGEPACSRVDSDGFYGIAVPRSDPDNDDTGIDIVPVFSLDHGKVRALTSRGIPMSVSGLVIENVNGVVVSLGEYSVRTPLGDARQFAVMRWMYDDVLDAYRYFKDTFGYDAPLVTLQSGSSSFYDLDNGRIALQTGLPTPREVSTRAAVLHEYGHHIMNHVYDNGIPPTLSCRPHSPTLPSSPACAWSEGWASFVPALMEDSPQYNTSFGADDGHFNWETREEHSRNNSELLMGSLGITRYYEGQDGEGSVTAILWDIHDGGNEPGDNIAGGAQGIWTAFADDRDAGEAFEATSIHDFYDDWVENGGQNLDSVFTINGVDPTGTYTPPSLTLSVERNGSARTGDNSRYARAGDVVVATLDFGGPVTAGTTPEASVLSNAQGSMVSGTGEARHVWIARGTVGDNEPNGQAPITILAMAPGAVLAPINTVGYDNTSYTVSLALERVPTNGTYEVTARAAIADLNGVMIGSDQSRRFEWNAANPRVEEAFLSPNGKEITLLFSEGLDTETVHRGISNFGRPVERHVHVDGSNKVMIVQASALGSDGTYYVDTTNIITDTQGHRHAGSRSQVEWDASTPTFEHATISSNGRTISVTMSERSTIQPASTGSITLDSRLPGRAGLSPYPTVGTTHTITLASPPPPGTYEVTVHPTTKSGNKFLTSSQTRSFTYNPAGPTFEHVTESSDGQTLTLTFSAGLDGDTVTQDRFILGPGISLADTNPIMHVDGSPTVMLKLVAAPAYDGTYSVTAKSTIGGTSGGTLGSDQTRKFVWNPKAPTLDRIEVSSDARKVKLIFSEGILAASVNTTTIEHSPTMVVDRTTPIEHTDGSNTVTLNLAQALMEGAHFIKAQHHIADSAGRQMTVTQKLQFTWDAVPPALESVRASDNGTSLILTFSEGLDTETVTTDNFVLSAELPFVAPPFAVPSNNPISHVDGDAYVLIKLKNRPNPGPYTITAKSGIRDMTGVASSSDQSIMFTRNPAVPNLESASMSSDGRMLQLTFSTGIDTGTITKDNITLSSRNTGLFITEQAANHRIIVDTVAPRLLDAFFTSTTSARLEFSEPLDATTVKPTAFGVTREDATITATPSYTVGERVVTLDLSPALTAGIAHTMHVKAGLADRAGNSVETATKTLPPPSTAIAAPTFEATRTSRYTVITFSEDVRVIEGQELNWRDWAVSTPSGFEPRSPGHFVDLDNRRIVLDTVPPLRSGEDAHIEFSPYGGNSPKIENLSGYDMPVGTRANLPSAIFPAIFAEAHDEGIVRIEFDETLAPAEPMYSPAVSSLVSGRTEASEWKINGVQATGIMSSVDAETRQTLDVNGATRFYLKHGVAGLGGTLQVEYLGPGEGSTNSLMNSHMNALAPVKVTSVDRIPNAFTAGEFLDSKRIRITAAKAIDARLAAQLQIQNVPLALIPTDNPLTAVLRLEDDAQDGCIYEIQNNFSTAVARINDGSNKITYTDTHAPVINSATSTSGTTTEVRFNEPVSFGALPTVAQHRGHWEITDAGTDKEISAVAVRAGSPSVVEITHAPLARTDSTPTVAYNGGADDDARIRDTRTSPCTTTDATPKNDLSSNVELVASDGAAPGATVSAAVSRNGEPKSGTNAQWARAGDTITVSLDMDEAGRPTSPPRLASGGTNTGMTSGMASDMWSGERTVASDETQGPLAFTITALDAAANLGVFTHAGASTNAMVDTVTPDLSGATTSSATTTRVTLSEGAWGIVRAADWVVGEAAATGVAVGEGGVFTPTITMSGGTAFTLQHAILADTAAVPTVAYRPPGSPVAGPGGGPDAAPGPGSAPDTTPPPPAPPAEPDPPAASIEFDAGGLDGASVRTGETRSFDVSVTRVEGGGFAIILLSGQPDFVTVQNTGINAATITVDASHASAMTGDYTFIVMAATGSDPASKSVTITVTS